MCEDAMRRTEARRNVPALSFVQTLQSKERLRPAATASRPQAPVQPETSAMPANNGVRLHDRQRIANVWKKPVETNEYQAIEDAERGSLRSNPPQNVDLLAQCPISASSAARDRNRSTTAQPMSLKRSLITRQHRPILGQTPTGSGFRQGQPRPTHITSNGVIPATPVLNWPS